MGVDCCMMGVDCCMMGVDCCMMGVDCCMMGVDCCMMGVDCCMMGVDLWVVVGLMHGDMDQNTRNQVITAFKKKEMPVLIATDVAGGCHL